MELYEFWKKTTDHSSFLGGRIQQWECVWQTMVLLITGYFKRMAPTSSNRHTFGGSDWDYSNSASITSDGGVLLFGMSYSSDSMPFATPLPCTTMWVVKPIAFLIINGVNVRENLKMKPFDGIETPDGGYLVVGYTKSFNGDVHGMHSGTGCWVC